MVNPIIQRALAKIAFFSPGGYSFRAWLHRMRGVKIGKNVWISQYVYLDDAHPENITLEDNVSVGLRSTIFTHLYSGNYGPGKKTGKVIIKKNAYIGPHCVIFHNVTIGEGAVVAAGSMVAKDVPPAVLYGPPSPKSLAKVTSPLIKGENMDYERFLLGLRPLKN